MTARQEKVRENKATNMSVQTVHEGSSYESSNKGGNKWSNLFPGDFSQDLNDGMHEPSDANFRAPAQHCKSG